MPKLPEILQDRGTDLDRLKAFSDGVFSIAITLLALSLQVPKSEDGLGLGKQLSSIALPMMSYCVSFAMVGLYWTIHCRLFRYLKAHSRGLVMYNLLFLFFVSLLPVTTPLVYTFRKDLLAWSIYYGNLSMVGFSAWFLWLISLRHGFIHDDTPHLVRRYILARSFVPGLVFLLTAIFVQVDFRVALFFPLLIAIFMKVVNVRYSRLAETAN